MKYLGKTRFAPPSDDKLLGYNYYWNQSSLTILVHPVWLDEDGTELEGDQYELEPIRYVEGFAQPVNIDSYEAAQSHLFDISRIEGETAPFGAAFMNSACLNTDNYQT